MRKLRNIVPAAPWAPANFSPSWEVWQREAVAGGAGGAADSEPVPYGLGETPMEGRAEAAGGDADGLAWL
jgi:hypothetical protein